MFGSTASGESGARGGARYGSDYCNRRGKRPCVNALVLRGGGVSTAAFVAAALDDFRLSEMPRCCLLHR